MYCCAFTSSTVASRYRFFTPERMSFTLRSRSLASRSRASASFAAAASPSQPHGSYATQATRPFSMTPLGSSMRPHQGHSALPLFGAFRPRSFASSGVMKPLSPACSPDISKILSYELFVFALSYRMNFSQATACSPFMGHGVAA